eukprot:1145625-Pelagomonas_calceolata.AAC.3
METHIKYRKNILKWPTQDPRQPDPLQPDFDLLCCRHSFYSLTSSPTQTKIVSDSSSLCFQLMCNDQSLVLRAGVMMHTLTITT